MKRPYQSLLLSLALLLVAPTASASPVAQTEEERELYGRSFLEPNASYNYIQLGEGGKGEFDGGMKLLAKLFPRYLTYTTVGKELGSKHAVSVGPDGYPSWHNKDSGDGIPFHLGILTDKKVPDRKKEYVALMASHQAEPCGREGMYRLLEDLIVWATEDPDHTLDNATGASGKTMEYRAAEILRKTKIYFVSPNPDGWRAGDGMTGGHSQYNGAEINSNRVAYQDGWIFPPDPVLYRQGYSTLTQPEGAAVIKYLQRVRERELNGKPFAVGMDLHGPFPLGFILLHDQGNDPQKLEQMVDLGTRIGQNMEETMPPAAVTDPALDDATEALRQSIPDSRELGTQDQNFWRQSAWARWSFVTHIADSLSYTAGSTWGGWMNSRSGLDAISLSYEINCQGSTPWTGPSYQRFVDNVKAVYETGLVTAAAMADDKLRDFRHGFKGKAGFLEHGERVTDRDGNPTPPPPNFPNNPFYRQIRQAPYNVANTDYFRDLRTLVPRPPVEVRSSSLRSRLDSLDTFVVSDAQVKDVGALDSFVQGGGNLILTDSALRMLPKLTKVKVNAVGKAWGYVGYSDLNRNHPWTHDLLATARQTFDPTGLGYPLLMERDGYWQDEGPQGASSTKNSAPMWLVDRDVWEEAGGATIGTADPPEDRKQTSEGTSEDRTTIGTIEAGKGRIVIFGALLPQPTEEYAHWFGLNGYTISAAGQTMLLRAMSWGR